MRFKLFLTLVSVFFISFSCEKPKLSLISSNIDDLLEHITKIEPKPSRLELSGFHHYKPASIEAYRDVKIVKIHDTVWVITQENPDGYHKGMLLYIFSNAKGGYTHGSDYKTFFPSLWDKETLSSQISKIIAKVKSYDFRKIKCQKSGTECSCEIYTTLESNPIKVFITYDNMQNVKVRSVYPIGDLDEVNISRSSILNIMQDQKNNFFFNKNKGKQPEPVVDQKSSCVIQ